MDTQSQQAGDLTCQVINERTMEYAVLRTIYEKPPPTLPEGWEFTNDDQPEGYKKVELLM